MRKFFSAVMALLIVMATIAGCNNQNSASGSSAAFAPDSINSARNVTANIVYINTDSLISNYDLYVELATQLQEKSTKIEANLTSRGRNLERDIINYQDQVQKGLVIRSQAQSMEEDLNKKQQDFMSYREQALTELAEEEEVMFNRIRHNLAEFLDEFNAGWKYDMIISTGTAGPILNANPALDITGEVLAGLNRKYSESKK